MMIEDVKIDAELLLKLKHSPIKNYVVPGLTSWLITQPGPNGCMRLFTASRSQTHFVTPHNHRYDFTAFVIQGYVVNTIYRLIKEEDENDEMSDAERFAVCDLHKDFTGVFAVEQKESAMFVPEESEYHQGSSYSMRYEQFHTIEFSKDAIVLVIESEQKSGISEILQPVVDGVMIPTFKVEPWMYQK